MFTYKKSVWDILNHYIIYDLIFFHILFVAKLYLKKKMKVSVPVVEEAENMQ